MPYRKLYEDPELFLEYNGIKVYHTYTDDNFYLRNSYIFTTDIMFTQKDGLHNSFDVRKFDLEKELSYFIHQTAEDQKNIKKKLIQRAIYNKEIS